MAYQKPIGHSGEPAIEIISSDYEHDPIALTIGHMAVGVERARHAADTLAESYRLFYVGATGYAYNAETNVTAMITAANFKLRLNDDEIDEFDIESIPKICAEMGVVNAAFERGFTRLIAMAIVGTADPKKIEAVTYRKTDTLHPCGDCRNVLHHARSVDKNTQIITVGFQDEKSRDVDVFQSQTYKQFMQLYRKPLKEFVDPPSAPYVPYEWNERHQLYLAERAELDLPPIAEFPGDISRNKALVKLGRWAMSAELDLAA